MFKKLLSNLPFNPSLIGQVSFYSKRLRAEGSVRKLGFIFLALSLGVQGFAVLAPSEPSLASSTNDIIYGGINSREDAINHCRHNHEINAIFAHFGISCDALVNTTIEHVHTRSWDGQLYSLGRNPYGKFDERAVVIGGKTYYSRPTWTWGDYSFKAIQGTTDKGMPFMIMFDCGNPVTYGPPPPPELPPPPPPPPAPEKVINCANLGMSVSNKARVSLGSSVSVRGQASGRNLPPNDTVVMYYELSDAESGRVIERQHGEGITFNGNVAQDPIWRIFKMEDEGHFVFKLKVTYNGGSKTAPGSEAGQCRKEVFVETPPPCDDIKDEEDALACLELSKRVANETQGIDDANGTEAKAGDILVYTLSVHNTSTNTTIEDFVIEENIADILEYADVVDLYGGTLSEDNIIRWPAVDIEPEATVRQQLKVKVKDPVPQTPVSASNPGSFDLLMVNVYGNTVEVKLPPTTPKVVEQTSQSLPNTGPGETMAVAFVVTTGAGYFLARTRLMAKELDIVRSDYAAGGTS